MVINFFKSGYQKLKGALAKTGAALGRQIRTLFNGPIDQETLEKLEQILYEADLGVNASLKLTNKIKEVHEQNPDKGPEALVVELRKEIINILSKDSTEIMQVPQEKGPLIILIVGVNGNGKTTSVAKLAKKFHDEGKKTLLAAADTFRAAAIEQLEIWSKRLNIEIIKGTPKSDPAAVVFDAINAAKARGSEVVLIDTAGRLHTKTNLMQELEKIKRSCRKIYPESPHETLLVLDATVGQNAIDQAKIFHKYTPITGIILTKLDGTAKGGIVVSIQEQLGIPVKFIGVGENLEDLMPFQPESFVNALFEE